MSTATATVAPKTRVTLEDATTGPLVIKGNPKATAEVRLESKRGQLIAAMHTKKGVNQIAFTKKMGWQDRDFADGVRLAARVNGETCVRDAKGNWHAK